jgi:two-component system sensor histidine kinase DegS
MECRSSDFSILIRDNGKGIDPADQKRFHRGLTGMPERMKQIEGTFSIESGKPGGTAIRLTLPL